MCKIIVPKYWIFLFCCLYTQLSYGQTCNVYDDNELIFSLNPSNERNMANFFASHGGTIKDINTSAGANLYLVEFTFRKNSKGYTSIEEVHDYFECNHGINGVIHGKGKVRAVEFNYDISSNDRDEGFTHYNLNKYNPYSNCSKEFINSACPINQDASTTVAVVDAGHQWGTPFDDFITLTGTYDFVDNDFSPNDISIMEHGVKVNSVIAGILANRAGNTFILPIKILDRQGETTLYTLYEGILAAIEADVDVINLSLGAIFCAPDQCSSVFNDLMDIAADRNILVSGAAGNDGKLIDYPNGYYHIPSSSDANNLIISGSVNCRNRKSSFSNYGPIHVDVFALGEKIPVYPNHLVSGTSFTAPQFSALAALLGISEEPYQVVKSAILDHVDSYNLPCSTGGVLNANTLLNCTNFLGSRSAQQDREIALVNTNYQIETATLKANFLANGWLSITITSPIAQATTISVISLSGNMVKEINTNLKQGSTSIQFQNLQPLPAGMYIVQAQIEQSVLIQKSIKTN